jgi:hypothetical protein
MIIFFRATELVPLMVVTSPPYNIGKSYEKDELCPLDIHTKSIKRRRTTVQIHLRWVKMLHQILPDGNQHGTPDAWQNDCTLLYSQRVANEMQGPIHPLVV